MHARDLFHIERRVRDRRPQIIAHTPAARAAVAVVLAPGDEELRMLLIRRAEHPLDPWSGHMAFPGGRHDEIDATLEDTAIRETLEEVGIDLATDGRLVARLDDLQATARGRALDLIISPFLFTLESAREATIDETEVAEALWVPMEVFRDQRFHGTKEVSRDGFRADFPAFLVGGHAVWGLTYRMIRGLVEAIDGGGVAPASSAG
jgi:8-oxo-dGTP pyrophosphatase MutT (NUDIX family)